MENINIWKLSEQPYMDELIKEINNKLHNETCLLDMNKSKYSVLEKYVHDIAMFHLKRLNKDCETDCDTNNSYFVEFWVKDKYQTSALHVDCDEYLKKEQLEYNYPMLSSVTYLNDSKIPTVITNIDMDRYMYKEFEKELSMFFSFPKTGKQITFDGKYFHGSAFLDYEIDTDVEKNEDRYIIAINLWDKKPTNIGYYNDDNTCEEVIYIVDDVHKSNEPLIQLEFEELQETNNILTIGLDKDVMNYKLFENILYKPSECGFKICNKIINHKERDSSSKSEIHNYKVFLDETIEQKKLESQLKTKYGNILEDANELMDETNTIKYNRFLQRFIYPKIYCSNVCTWIINECEKYAEKNGGWTRKRHSNYPTTDLPVENVTAISGFVFGSLKIISEKIKCSYGLTDEIKLDYNDLFIVKYEDVAQNFLEIHKDGSFLSFNILLSNCADFEGGGTYFDDGLIMKGEQGDLIIHSSKINHSGVPITKGTRYLLVGFVNIQISI